MCEVRNVQPDDHRGPTISADPGAEGLLVFADHLTLEVPGIAGIAGLVEELEETGTDVVFKNVRLTHAAHMKVINGITFMQLFSFFTVRRGDQVVGSHRELRVIGGGLPPVYKVPFVYPRVLFRKKLT